MATIRMNSLKYHQLKVGTDNIIKSNKELINALNDLNYHNQIIYNNSSRYHHFSVNYEDGNIYKILDNYFAISCKDKNSKFISDTDFIEVEYKEVIELLNTLDKFENKRIETCKEIETAKKFLIDFFNKNC